MSISKGFRYKDEKGKVTDYEYGVNGSNVTQDANHRLVTDEEKKKWNGKADPEDIPSGSAASYSVANNDTTTQAGFVADARIVKQHGDEIDQLSSELAAAKQSFQAGVDTLYSKCSSRGATPSAKTPMAIAGAIDKIYTDRYNAGKKAAEIKTVSKSAEYPMAGANGEQTVDFSVDFGAVSGYKLAYAGITALDTYISNGTIKYVQFSNLRISGTKATWSVHTARGTGGGNNTCTVQGIFIPA